MKRLFLIVLDSVGIGALPDACDFGDAGANTMGHISASDEFRIPSLLSLGLGNIEGLSYLGTEKEPLASYGRCAERSRGKDTTIGHWEICGIVSKTPLPTYPDGFPKELLDEFSRRVGRGVLCNKPYDADPNQTNKYKLGDVGNAATVKTADGNLLSVYYQAYTGDLYCSFLYTKWSLK